METSLALDLSILLGAFLQKKKKSSKFGLDVSDTAKFGMDPMPSKLRASISDGNISYIQYENGLCTLCSFQFHSVKLLNIEEELKVLILPSGYQSYQ